MVRRGHFMAALPEERTLPDSDEQLAARIGRGDDAAFDELYRRYAKPLTGFAARILRDHAAGEDVAQTALMNAFRSIRGGTVPLAVRPWLYRIAQNTAITAHRSRRGEIVEPEFADIPARTADSGFDRDVWVAGVRALPARQRDVYLLRDVNGLPSDEVGARTGLTAVQVEQALFAARNRLAEHLSFGGRVDCDAVRVASAADGEHRALKAHLRACASCRKGLAKVKVGLVTSVSGWARQFAEWAVGGGAAAPIAAKVGAVVATAALGAATAPVAVHAVERAVAPKRAHATTVAATSTASPAAAMPGPFGAGVAALIPAARRTGPGRPAAAAAAPVPGQSAPTTAGAGDTSATGDTTADETVVVDETTDTSTDPGATEPDPAAVDPAPVDDTPPADAAPVDEAPVDQTPVDEAPVDEAPADTTPVDAPPLP
jgi:RNA polymerase sigma factor (sigma-70 family)